MSKIISIVTMLTALAAFTVSGATITGTVTNSSTDAAVSGVTIVLLTDSATVKAKDTVTSANNGSYTLSNVAIGNYSLAVSKTGFVTDTIDVIITGSSQTRTRNISLVPVGQPAVYGAIGGTVTNSAGNAAIAGATVILRKKSGTGSTAPKIGIDTMVTSANGKYLFTGVAVATNYSVSVIAYGFNPDEKSQNEVKANDTTTVNFALVKLPAANTRIYGTVRDSASKALLSGAIVILRFGTTSGSGGTGTVIWANVDTITTAADGWFRFDSLSASTGQTPYSLVVSKAGYTTYTSGNITVATGVIDTNNVLLKKSATGAGVSQAPGMIIPSSATISFNNQGGLVFENAYNDGTISFYMIDGREVHSQSVKTGINTIALPAHSGGTMIAVVKGDGFSIVKKLTMCR
jgi:hypothetical protein